jgi:hypothetical protein
MSNDNKQKELNIEKSSLGLWTYIEEYDVWVCNPFNDNAESGEWNFIDGEWIFTNIEVNHIISSLKKRV